jgi:hypothetical protein
MSIKTKRSNARSSFVRVAKLHVVVGVIFMLQIIIYDAGKLITPEVVLKRWIISGILVLAGIVCWYLARLNDSTKVILNLAWFLIAIDMVVGSFSIYTQRGMASRAVLLFVLPILVAGALRRWGMIYLTAVISVITYTTTAVAYFVLNFNEAYKLELYGEIGFYSALILVVAGMVWALVRTKH